MATKMIKTRYVEYGGRATAPGPFLCTEGRFRGMLLKADKRKIDDFVDRVLNEPAGGAVMYRAPTSYVMLLNGWFGKVRAMTAPFDEWGTVREVQVSLWIPLLQGYEENGRFVGEKIVQAVPYIVVDNPMSYAGGRETYGYPKSLGRFTFEDDVNGEMTVATYGGDFNKDNQADWFELLKIAPARGPAPEGADEELVGTEEFVNHVTDDKLDPDGETLLPGGIRILKNAIEDALAGRSHQIFLKQFRDVRDPEGACYQEIVHAPITLHNRKMKFSPAPWRVDIADMKSHPIAEELGVTSQTTLGSYAMDIDFTCERGEPVTLQPVVPALLA